MRITEEWLFFKLRRITHEEFRQRNTGHGFVALLEDQHAGVLRGRSKFVVRTGRDKGKVSCAQLPFVQRTLSFDNVGYDFCLARRAYPKSSALHDDQRLHKSRAKTLGNQDVRNTSGPPRKGAGDKAAWSEERVSLFDDVSRCSERMVHGIGVISLP